MEFRKFTQQEYEATLAKWTKEAEDCDCFPEEVPRKLAFIQESLGPTQGSVFQRLAYGLFANDEPVATGVCELVLSNKGLLGGKWIKLMNLVLSPEIDTKMQDEDMAAMHAAVSAYKAAALGAFSVRLEHDADTLKLYARNDQQLRFLMVLLATIKDDSSSNLRASRQGRWLVLEHDI
ncbi:hypothetical protein [Acidovorax sp. PRC11]|uniref:hypothetical protein n=1 Tax=Acidovorax sp. PRC11 TaxID=2962592 RepID=UPI002880F42D|nr:hypothetical protein [Acidovorax sp. PRC11]MDT0137738.1 hypothetical protein [Acidovorax sp. PRC11]